MFTAAQANTSVKTAISNGEIIFEYLDDKPYPSFLVLWFEDNVLLHVVVAQNTLDDSCYIIMVYVPSSDLWKAE